MAKSLSAFFVKYDNWIRTLVVIAAFAAMQFLNSKYVQIETYTRDKESAAKAAEVLAAENRIWRESTSKSLQELKDIASQQTAAFTMLRDQVMTQHQKELDDHEARIRLNEEFRASHSTAVTPTAVRKK